MKDKQTLTSKQDIVTKTNDFNRSKDMYQT